VVISQVPGTGQVAVTREGTSRPESSRTRGSPASRTAWQIPFLAARGGYSDQGADRRGVSAGARSVRPSFRNARKLRELRSTSLADRFHQPHSHCLTRRSRARVRFVINPHNPPRLIERSTRTGHAAAKLARASRRARPRRLRAESAAFWRKASASRSGSCCACNVPRAPFQRSRNGCRRPSFPALAAVGGADNESPAQQVAGNLRRRQF